MSCDFHLSGSWQVSPTPHPQHLSCDNLFPVAHQLSLSSSFHCPEMKQALRSSSGMSDSHTFTQQAPHARFWALGGCKCEQAGSKPDVSTWKTMNVIDQNIVEDVTQWEN